VQKKKTKPARFRFSDEERPPQIINIVIPLTEEQKKWPVVPLSKMFNAKPKSKQDSEKQVSEPS
jgi:hypothetical protein